MAFLRIHKLTEKDEIGYFAPRTWDFWRALIVCFCLCCILGHWLEMPYCWLMDRLFGIVADDYAVWTDPWYHPYWVYGFGAVFVTLLLSGFSGHPVAVFLLAMAQMGASFSAK